MAGLGRQDSSQAPDCGPAWFLLSRATLAASWTLSQWPSVLILSPSPEDSFCVSETVFLLYLPTWPRIMLHFQQNHGSFSLSNFWSLACLNEQWGWQPCRPWVLALLKRRLHCYPTVGSCACSGQVPWKASGEADFLLLPEGRRQVRVTGDPRSSGRGGRPGPVRSWSRILGCGWWRSRQPQQKQQQQRCLHPAGAFQEASCSGPRGPEASNPSNTHWALSSQDLIWCQYWCSTAAISYLFSVNEIDKETMVPPRALTRKIQALRRFN